MKAEELRIGNWIESKWDGSKILKVGKVHNSNVNNVPINLIHPIPLTEEILLKAGFENTQNTIWTIYNNSLISLCKMMGGEYYEVLDTCTRLKYVHQLQNLYFALTGEELEIEL